MSKVLRRIATSPTDRWYGLKSMKFAKFLHHSLQMFEEKVRICDEGLKKVCDEGTVGRGEEICKTHYETTCETRLD